MPPARSKPEYRGNSCHQCHKQKVKCSRERPCRNCALANRPCTYAVRDRKITVSENYIRRLEQGLVSPQRSHSEATPRLVNIVTNVDDAASRDVDIETGHRALEATVENSTAELFVSKLKQIRSSKTSPGTFDTQSQSANSSNFGHSHEPRQKPKYEYFALDYDNFYTKCTFKLPPYPYVVYLLDKFAIYLGHDWHWFRLKRFRQRLDSTYMDAHSAETKDRIWLCQLLVVLALAESVNDAGRRPEITLDLVDHTSPSVGYSEPASSPPPGSEFFEQVLRLFNIPFEDASIDHIEALNLIVLYSNQLNRRKTAYMYAGTASRLCHMLQIHRASTSLDYSPVEREHRKRLWWSTYCLDRTTSSQEGLSSSLQVDKTDLDYPTNAHLSTEEAEEFSDPDYLTARIQLTIIEAENAKSAGQSTGSRNIGSMLRKLETWKTGLPSHMALDMQDGLPNPTRSLPCTRSLANFHIRYNQCVMLLLRPLLLKQIARIFSDDHSSAPQEESQELNDKCLRAARSNLRIFRDIRSYGLLVRLGFMENMHLFTSLMILRLAISINLRHPGSFHHQSDDAGSYEAGKEILVHMMQSGSLAAKGHLNMLQEVEDFGDVIATEGGVGFNDGEQWDVDEWMAQLFDNGEMLNGYDWQAQA